MFFQLEEADEDRLERAGKGFPKGKEKVIQFILQAFTDTEGRYFDIERECLAILRALEEVRFLALQSRWPIAVYTDAVALISILQKDDTRGRIAGWQVRLAKYEIEPRHTKTKDMAIVDGMARMPYQGRDSAWTRNKGWEDVRLVTVEDVVDEYDIQRGKEGLEDEPKGGEGYEKKVLEDADEKQIDDEYHKWSKWISDDWYSDIVLYLLTGSVPNQQGRDSRRIRKIKLESRKYSLVDMEDSPPALTYREINRERSKCVIKKDVGKILQ